MQQTTHARMRADLPGPSLDNKQNITICIVMG